MVDFKMISDGQWLDDAEMDPHHCDEDQTLMEDHNYSKKIIVEDAEDVNQNNSRPSQSDVMNIKLMFNLKPMNDDFFESIMPVKKKRPNAADLLKNVVNFLKALYLQRSRKAISFEPSAGIRSNQLESQATTDVGKQF